jgi:hypothetical protein
MMTVDLTEIGSTRCIGVDVDEVVVSVIGCGVWRMSSIPRFRF